VYAHTDSVPTGDRLGSAVVICPTITNGSDGTSPVASAAA
jgi:hypothetical protein